MLFEAYLQFEVGRDDAGGVRRYEGTENRMNSEKSQTSKLQSCSLSPSRFPKQKRDRRGRISSRIRTSYVFPKHQDRSDECKSCPEYVVTKMDD